MSDLRSLFPVNDYIVGGAAGALERVYVFNTSTHSASNGGRCCLWTVPSGTTWATFEVWGGGSAGPGSCCCQQPAQAGGAGAYARKTISVQAGDTYRICAAGSTCCSPSCCGTEGFPSYVQTENNGNGGDSINLCARGGPRSCGKCFALTSTQNYYGQTCTCNSDSYCGHDFGLPAISGSARSFWCYSNSLQYIPQGPNYGGGIRASYVYCQTNSSGCETYNGSGAAWPGGGGAGAFTNGSYCWGGWGAGGLVIVTFR